MSTTCNHALYAIVDVFSQYYSSIPSSLIDELYRHIVACVQQDNEQLAKSTLNCLENFLISCGKQFNEAIWDKSCACLLQIFRSTLPEKFVLFDFDSSPIIFFVFRLLTWQNSTNGAMTTDETNVTICRRVFAKHRLWFFFSTDVRSHEQFVRSCCRWIAVVPPPSHLDSSVGIRIARRSNQWDETISDDRSIERVFVDFQQFQSFTRQSLVQMELIQTIDNLFFYPSSSKKDDLQMIHLAQVFPRFVLIDLSASILCSLLLLI